nr:MAG TPA: tail tube protein [Caudoviricetes sp.]
MNMFIENVDMTDIVPKGVKFNIGNKEYELIFDFNALLRLSEVYGGFSAAIDALQDAEHKYAAVVNFLYCGLTDKYKVTKDDVKAWMGVESSEVFYRIVAAAVAASSGKCDDEDEDAPGEA